MKIIDNKKDYYDYLASIYGIDELVVYDRRGSVTLNTDKVLLHGMEFYFSNRILFQDKPTFRNSNQLASTRKPVSGIWNKRLLMLFLFTSHMVSMILPISLHCDRCLTLSWATVLFVEFRIICFESRTVKLHHLTSWVITDG